MESSASAIWLPEYSVGSLELDRQHARLLKLCRVAEACLELDDDDPAMPDKFIHLLAELGNYANVHFETEERLLARVGYPALREQESSHVAYDEILSGLLFDAIEGKFDKRQALTFLTEWWLNHILVDDMKFASYFARQVEAA